VDDDPGVRVLTWNVWKMFGDPLAVRRVLVAARPDVVCLQEGPARFWSTWMLTRLAEGAGLRFVTGGRAAAGNALLCSPRMRVEAAESLRFRPANRWIQRRGAVLATVGPAGGPALRLAGTHLSLDPGERRAHVAALLDRLSAPGPPCVVTGDLNESAGGPAWLALAAVASDPVEGSAPTYPARAPRRRIDAVLTAPSLSVTDYGPFCPDPHLAARASDHLPVLAVVRVR
jgi:endonuclease/exonuclease/phosphatase family metal-dependent hydrolase